MSSRAGGARPLLIVAALWAEALPIARRLEGARPLGPRHLAGALAGRPVALLASGVGPRNAARRTAAALARQDCAAVLSLGTCGALVEGLPDGTLVTGRQLGGERGGARAALPLPGLRAVSIATVERVVVEPERRLSLARGGFEVCEMEALAVAEAAGPRVVRALKVVSDQAGADASPRLDGAPLPSPLKIARFQRHAWRLVEERALPVLLALLAEGALEP